MLHAIDSAIGLHLFFFLLVLWPVLVSRLDLRARSGRLSWLAVAAAAGAGMSIALATLMAYLLEEGVGDLEPAVLLPFYVLFLIGWCAVHVLADLLRWRRQRRGALRAAAGGRDDA